MSGMLFSRLRCERGASLVLVLAFLAGFGVFSGVLLAQIQVHEKVTETVRGLDNSGYAADGGLEYAVDALRRDPNSCANSGLGTQTLGSVTIHGTSVAVECQTYGSGDPGNGFGPGQFAVITTSTGPNSFTTQSGGTPIISGLGTGAETPHLVAAFIAGGLNLLQNVQVQGGDVDKQQATLSSPQCAVTPPTHLIMVAPYQYCTTVVSTPDYPNSLPTTHPVAAPAFWDKNGNCRVFYPGLYSSVPSLSLGKSNYFASGVFYFQNVGQWQITNGTTVVAGAPGSDTPASGFPSACATDADALGHNAGAAVSSTGVKFILAGTSQFSVKNGSAQLFTRVPTGASEGAGFSVQQVRSSQADAFWLAPNLGGANILETITGNNALAVHGKVYVPEGPVSLFATNAVVGQLDGGVVANTLALQASNSISPGGFAVGTVSGSGSGSTRLVRIKATPAVGSAYQGVVKVDPGLDYALRPATIVSWRKCVSQSC